MKWTIRLCSKQPTLSSRKEPFQLNDFDFRSALCATEHDHRSGKTVPVTCKAKMLLMPSARVFLNYRNMLFALQNEVFF